MLSPEQGTDLPSILMRPLTRVFGGPWEHSRSAGGLKEGFVEVSSTVNLEGQAGKHVPSKTNSTCESLEGWEPGSAT